MSVIILNQAVIHYETLGRGRPVVFLHGWVGSWRYWMSCMQVASTTYRAYALDLFGYGETAHEAASYALEKQAGLLGGFLDDLGIGTVALVGHGLGAWVAFVLASQQPERVARILAVSAPLDSGSVNSRLQTAGPSDLVDWLSDGTAGSLAALSDASKADARAAAASLNTFRSDGVFSRVREAGTPCLLVYGQNDPLLAIPHADLTGALGPNVHQFQLENSGHFPMLDSADRFNRILTEFLALETGLSPRELQLKEQWRRRVR